jgi:Glycosyl hydrolases family 2, TIM barrel domain
MTERKNTSKFYSAKQRITDMGKTTCILVITVLLLGSCKSNDSKYTAANNPSKKVYIQKENGIYRLCKNGKPFLIKGAAGHTKIAELVACGGNTISIWDTTLVEKVLDEAQRNNVSVIAGLDIPSGDIIQYYQDEKKVNALFNAYKSIVTRLKNHPALLAWALGNELVMPFGSNTSPFYKTYNRLLEMMHTEDPDHPVTTTIINFQKGSILNINWKIPGLDFISINTYNELKEIRSKLRNFSLLWDGPYMITEWSPNGGWESETTIWKAPIENTSTKKAEQYAQFYKEYMPKNDPRFLGSLAFYWGNRQEYTHTWFSVFNEDGTPTEIKEALSDCWKDTVTNHQAAALKYMLIDNDGARNNIILSPGSTHNASLLLADNQPADSLHYSWEILREDWFYWGRTWNNFKRPSNMKGLIKDSTGQNTSFVCPSKEGAYRIFITVNNSKGFSATANTPFYIVE